MRTLAIVLTLVLAGCASSPATKSELKAVMDPWSDCIWNAVARMDDGKSDPVSVAYGIEPSCAVLYEQVIQAELKGMPETLEMQIYMRRKYEDEELKSITDAVLTYRKSHVQQSKSAPTDSISDALVAANEARKRNDYATELKLLRPLAEQGNAVAQNNLGVMYFLGHGVPNDDVEAARWTRKSAEQGDAAAQFTLGVMYHEGRGVPQDYMESSRWFRKVAERGDPDAQASLGLMYIEGEGVQKDYVQAYMWFSLAAAGGYKNAAQVLEKLDLSMTSEQIAEAKRQVAEWRPVSSGK
jgi:TPR repeat protein